MMAKTKCKCLALSVIEIKEVKSRGKIVGGNSFCVRNTKAVLVIQVIVVVL